MTEYFKKAIDDLDIKINELLCEQSNFLVSCEKAIELILSDIAELKKYMLEKRVFKRTRRNLFFLAYQAAVCWEAYLLQCGL